MYFNRYDICEAYYLYFTQYHGGQNSKEYRRLSKMWRYFNPSPLLNDETNLSENALDIYRALVKKNEK